MVDGDRYIYRDLPKDGGLDQEYLEPPEVYEERPLHRLALGPGCGIYLLHYLRFEADHIVSLAEDGRTEERNLQLLFYYSKKRVISCSLKGKGTVSFHRGEASFWQDGVGASRVRRTGRVVPWP